MQRLWRPRNNPEWGTDRNICFTTKFFLMKKKLLAFIPCMVRLLLRGVHSIWPGSQVYLYSSRSCGQETIGLWFKSFIFRVIVKSSWWKITHRVRLKHPHLLLGLVNHLPAQFHSLVAHRVFLSKFFCSTMISDRSRWRGCRLPTSGFVRFVGGRLSCLFDRRSHFWPIQEIFTI